MIQTTSANPVVALSQTLLYAARTGTHPAAAMAQLGQLTAGSLQRALADDAAKKAFWINLYNAITQVWLQEAPDRYRNRGRFFTARRIRLAGRRFSLDDIEHRILRRSRIKWSFGYLGRPFPARWEKALRVQSLDPRIHFALNCGAHSCPPIAFYTPEKLDAQLDTAAKAYLTGEARWDAPRNRLLLPAIMGWFRGDFNGRPGILLLAKKYGLIPEGARPRIGFKKYDWSLSLNYYKSETE